MTVVGELDKTLFNGYVKSKSENVKAILRGGILDNEMDWYETPQPTGMFIMAIFLSHSLYKSRTHDMCRDSTLYVRSPSEPCGRACTSLQNSRTTSGPNFKRAHRRAR